MAVNMLAWPNCAKGAATVTADTLNVRQAGSTASLVVGKLARGTTVTVWCVVGDWWLIQAADGITGWCSATYLHPREELQA